MVRARDFRLTSLGYVRSPPPIGIELVLYLFTIWPISKRAYKRHPSDVTFALFTTAILCLNTVYVATESVFGEQMWITNENYPGGPAAYLADYASVWYETLGTAASIVLNLFGDVFLVCLLLSTCFPLH